MGSKSFWDVPKLSEKYIPGICGYQGVGPVTWLLSVQSTSQSQGLNIVGRGREQAHMIALCERLMLPNLSGDQCSSGQVHLDPGLSLERGVRGQQMPRLSLRPASLCTWVRMG